MNALDFSRDLLDKLQIVYVAGGVYYIGKEVAAELGFKDTNQAIRTHCREDILAKHSMDKLPLHPLTKLITEKDIYRMIIKSPLAATAKFHDWAINQVVLSVAKAKHAASDMDTINTMTSAQLKLLVKAVEAKEAALYA